MLQLDSIRKSYTTGDFTQVALDDVSISFRDSEFAAVLGTSGSGKTTMLNIIGGLDHYDSGDLIIDGISTKQYTDRDWDTYRNHRVGFIFQSYNLIPHQTVLSNVELALTLTGVDRAERRKRSIEALEHVGLGEHINKRPNQLSGGQMQRVAIARALVNDPEIVLADEPTGALDTDTGIQVMEILKSIANDRLVVMVTHNPDLAEQYATRIISLKDGRIVGDSNPFTAPVDAASDAAASVAPAAVATAGFVATGTNAADDMSGTAAERATYGEAGTVGTSDAAPIAGAAEALDSENTAELPHVSAAEAGKVTPAAYATDTPTGAAGVAAAAASLGSAVSGAVGGKGNSAKGNRKASMSFLTALSLSFNNLMTKKGRTALTAFAGSIGIIGIAAILALSNGVNNYIADTEEEALTSYPLTITKSSFDLSSLIGASAGSGSSRNVASPAPDEERTVNSVIPEFTIMSDMFARVRNNDLSAFKAYIESGQSNIYDYVNTIQYNYGVTPLVYMDNPNENGVVQINPSSMANMMSNGLNSSSSLMGTSSAMSSWQEMLDNREILEEQMEVVEGRWPESYDEVVLVLSSRGRISDFTLYSLGVYDPKVMKEMTQQALNGEEVVVPELEKNFTYADALNLTFAVVPSSSLYTLNAEQGTWTNMSNETEYMTNLINNEAIHLRVVGVVKAAEGASTTLMTEGVGYLPELTYELMRRASASEIVQQQLANSNVDVFTGRTFEELQDEQGKKFDMESMFSIDEAALQSAFSVDTSAFSGLGNISLDLSGLDMSSMGSSIDFSNLDLSSLTTVINAETIARMMQGAPALDLSDVTGDMSPEQRQALQTAQNALIAGYLSYATQNASTYTDASGAMNFSAAYDDYIATPEGQAQLAGLRAASGDAYADAVQNATRDYMTGQLAPYLTQQMAALMTQAASVVASEMSRQMAAQMAAASSKMGSQLASTISSQLSSQFSSLSYAMANAFSFDANAFANAIQFNMTQEDLTSLLTNYMNAEELTYSANLTKLGYAAMEDPYSIYIYPIDFPAKESVMSIIDDYNSKMEAQGQDDSVIQYTDIVGALMSSVTDIVNTISLVLVAFVAISLVVSSIMIAIITYISVLERRKEIGILRAMGASKLNIANIFNAETIIEGFISGVFAIAAVYIASVPVNAFVEEGWNVPNVMTLPIESALILIAISVFLTFVAGLIPSSMASRRDPVEALRSE